MWTYKFVHIHTNYGSGDSHEVCGRTSLFTYTQTMEVVIITTSMECAIVNKYVNTDFAVFSVLTTHFAPMHVVYDFLVTVKAAPHECLIRTGQP